jgi:hypothetical protein
MSAGDTQMRYFNHANSFPMKLRAAPEPGSLFAIVQSAPASRAEGDRRIVEYLAAGFTWNRGRWAKTMTAEEARSLPFQVERMN